MADEMEFAYGSENDQGNDHYNNENSVAWEETSFEFNEADVADGGCTDKNDELREQEEGADPDEEVVNDELAFDWANRPTRVQRRVEMPSRWQFANNMRSFSPPMPANLNQDFHEESQGLSPENGGPAHEIVPSAPAHEPVPFLPRLAVRRSHSPEMRPFSTAYGKRMHSQYHFLDRDRPLPSLGLYIDIGPYSPVTPNDPNARSVLALRRAMIMRNAAASTSTGRGFPTNGNVSDDSDTSATSTTTAESRTEESSD